MQAITIGYSLRKAKTLFVENYLFKSNISKIYTINKIRYKQPIANFHFGEGNGNR
jgi:hypothetical protein